MSTVPAMADVARRETRFVIPPLAFLSQNRAVEDMLAHRWRVRAAPRWRRVCRPPYRGDHAVDRREGEDANGDISPASMVTNHAIALLTVLSGLPERHDPDQRRRSGPAYQ
jgi:hypothetical protein